MRALFKYFYLLIFIWFLRKLSARLSTTTDTARVPVEECCSSDAPCDESRTYDFTLVRKCGKRSYYWFPFKCRERVAVDICTELVRHNPELAGKMALHRYPCHCAFESISGTLGLAAHKRIVRSMQTICREYVTRHPGSLPDGMPG